MTDEPKAPPSDKDDDAKDDDAKDDDAKAGAKAGWLANKYRLFAVVGLLSLIADQVTKIWARAALETIRLRGTGPCEIPEDVINRTCDGVPEAVISGFWHWKLSMNLGSAFGLFSSQGSFGRIFLTVVGIVAVGGMIYMLRKARTDQRVLHWALALVTGGAIGNLIDRIYYGAVTDFILWHVGDEKKGYAVAHWEHEWPVFNIADVVLVVGVGLMFIDMHKEGKREKARKKARQERARKQGLVKDLRVD